MANQIRALSVTFNVAGMIPTPSEGFEKRWKSILDLQGSSELPDIYAIGFQEVSVVQYAYDQLIKGNDAWTASIGALLYPLGFVQVRYVRVMGTVLAVFCRSKHLLRLRHIDTSYLRVRNMGQKAAVGVRFQLYGVHWAFINCHLTAHEWNYERRIEDYDYIVDNLLFPGLPEFANLLFHDYIVFMGDLNFRLAERGSSHDEIVDYVDKRSFQPLLEQDSLRKAQDDQRAFQDFSEAEITFPPTFKYKIGLQEFDRKRRPAYTDRILYKANDYLPYVEQTLGLSPENYTSIPEVIASDHKPVSCAFTGVVIPPELAVEKRLPAYKPIVNFNHTPDWQKGSSDLAASYQIVSGEGVYLHEWDWISLIKADFTSLEDYDAFTWSSRSRLTQEIKTASFGDEIDGVRPGKYCFLYVGVNNCILGRSNNFEIISNVIF